MGNVNRRLWVMLSNNIENTIEQFGQYGQHYWTKLLDIVDNTIGQYGIGYVCLLISILYS